MSEHTIPELTKPLSRSKHWDVGVDWPLAGERAARLEREDQLWEAFERIAKLEAALARMQQPGTDEELVLFQGNEPTKSARAIARECRRFADKLLAARAAGKGHDGK